LFALLALNGNQEAFKIFTAPEAARQLDAAGDLSEINRALAQGVPVDARSAPWDVTALLSRAKNDPLEAIERVGVNKDPRTPASGWATSGLLDSDGLTLVSANGQLTPAES